MAKVAKHVRVSLDQFQVECSKVLKDYDYVVSGWVIQQAVHKTAEEVAALVAANAPERTGEYAGSIQAGYSDRKKKQYSETVYSEKPKYRLTHLLENGHAKRSGGRTGSGTGGRVQGKDHWYMGWYSIPDRLLRHIKEALNNAP